MADDLGDLLRRTSELATSYLEGLPDRPVAMPVDDGVLRKALGGPIPDSPTDPLTVIEDLAAAVEPALVASAGPRFFGFVIGGAVPASLAADWLTSAWDQNAGLFVLSPAAAVVEETVLGWVKELLRLPSEASFAFVTGCQMANF